MKIYDDIDGYILAGGASMRMGRQKSELMIGGRSLVERAVSAMCELTGERVTVVGNDISVEAIEHQIRVVSDLVGGPLSQKDNQRAPIFGFYTALTDADNEWIAVLAVDLPFATGELLSRLASMRDDEQDATVPVQPDGRLQPLCAIYRRDVFLKATQLAIEAGELSLHKLLRNVRVRRVEPAELADLPGADYFFLNVNTPDDFEIACKLVENTGVVL